MTKAAATLVVAAASAFALSACADATPADVLTGDLLVHDPVLAQDGDAWFVYSTGNGTISDGNVQIRTSLDGKNWTYSGAVWEKKPEWLREEVPGVDNVWAPELYHHDDTWYLYYSGSTFGQNTSAIGVATNTSLDPAADDYEWVDHGVVVQSSSGDWFNAIDPGVVEDTDGTPWLVFGSFWGGIQMVEIEWPSGKPVDGAEQFTVADRVDPPNAIEAANVFERGGDYYMIYSRDSCCRGTDSTYNMAVGRASDVTGPYLDRDGVPLLEGGGTPLLETEGDRIGPGGQSVWGDTLAFHFYNAEHNGAHELAFRQLSWDSDGWPSVSW
ncbi:arabinan endo-1,5-alpha-L-arabinosidase [Microbacterium amylolyticum]|uniref:Arabinan endo-1,5-alpha-L-arabinosidase n=1 Tax=Microbacterium amylolyticum TaxID=936337 RepID=A0ABS4ZF39_9MICO|nr:arabinan endo-1,5-alpha-L-arabinosidase [Microbacterium amylolyticum]MBP2435889.1 arabinan endo-1,5-alpha-L-arabinosidase [Microbacterium amylolyticum]